MGNQTASLPVTPNDVPIKQAALNAGVTLRKILTLITFLETFLYD